MSDLKSDVVCSLCVCVRCDFVESVGVPKQVRVLYTKAGGGTGFTSKRGSCSVRVRHWWMLEDLDGGDA